MKKIIVLLALVFMSFSNEPKHSLTIEISGLKTNKGTVLVGIYNSEKTFLSKPIMGRVEKVTGKTVTITFTDVPKGVYAVSLFQDENNNGTLDTGMFGIPTEKYGFSNNAKGFMSAPSFDKAKFELKNNQTIKIKI